MRVCCAAPYMWAGSFADALQQSSAALGLWTSREHRLATHSLSYIPPTQDEVHASFEQARQRQPVHVDSRFALGRPARQPDLNQQHDTNASCDVQSSDSPQAPPHSADVEQQSTPSPASSENSILAPDSSLHSSSKSLHASLLSAEPAELQNLSQEYSATESSPALDNESKQSRELHPIGTDAPLTGSGASFDMPGDKPTWLVKLQHTWTDAMAYVHAAQQPISFFQAHSDSDLDPDPEHAHGAESALQGFAYSPWPQPSAVRSTQQLVTSRVQKYLSTSAAVLSTAHDGAADTVKQHGSSILRGLHRSWPWTKMMLTSPSKALQGSEVLSQLLAAALVLSHLHDTHMAVCHALTDT